MQNAYYEGDITTDANVVNYGGLVGYFVPGTWFSNSYYDMGNSTINGAAVLTVGGLYTSQYDAWAKQGGASVVVTPTSRLPLSMASSGLTQDGTGAYLISSAADLDALLPFTQSASGGAVNGYTFKLANDINMTGATTAYLPYFGATEFKGNTYSCLLYTSPSPRDCS